MYWNFLSRIFEGRNDEHDMSTLRRWIIAQVEVCSWRLQWMPQIPDSKWRTRACSHWNTRYFIPCVQASIEMFNSPSHWTRFDRMPKMWITWQGERIIEEKERVDVDVSSNQWILAHLLLTHYEKALLSPTSCHYAFQTLLWQDGERSYYLIHPWPLP